MRAYGSKINIVSQFVINWPPKQSNQRRRLVGINDMDSTKALERFDMNSNFANALFHVVCGTSCSLPFLDRPGEKALLLSISFSWDGVAVSESSVRSVSSHALHALRKPMNTVAAPCVSSLQVAEGGRNMDGILHTPAGQFSRHPLSSHKVSVATMRVEVGEDSERDAKRAIPNVHYPIPICDTQLD